MAIPHIIGADISKKSIDFAVYPSNSHLKISNEQTGFQQLVRWIRQQHIDTSQMLIVMEHTGLYSYKLEQFLHKHLLSFTKVSGLEIKLSMGIVRGKTDKVDACRIARFGFEKQYNLQPTQASSVDLQRLKMLSTTRDNLVRQRAGNITAVKELKQACGLSQTDSIIKSHSCLIKMLDKQIAVIEAETQQIISQNQSLSNNYGLLKTIKAVGPVLALAMIIKTENFTRFSNARKFACFCGTAPFEHSSGTSIRSKTKTSHLADKRMKTLLDLSAKVAIQYDKELKEYYLKRTANGKPKMSTINVVRNKLLYRIFAVINRQTPFVENYLQAA